MSPIPTKFEVDVTVHCRVIAFLFADTARDLVTLTFDLLTLNSYHTWRFKWPTLPPSVNTLRLFVHELRVTTVPIDYHRKCVCGHCACAGSRDQWVGGQNNYIFGILYADLPIHYTTFIGLRRRLKVVYSRASPMLSTWLRKVLVRDLVTLTFDRLILNSRRTWRVTWPTLPPRLYDYSFMSYELWRFLLITIENAPAATAHAPNHVTCD